VGRRQGGKQGWSPGDGRDGRKDHPLVMLKRRIPRTGEFLEESGLQAEKKSLVDFPLKKREIRGRMPLKFKLEGLLGKVEPPRVVKLVPAS